MTFKDGAAQPKSPLSMGLDAVRLLGDAIESMSEQGDVSGLEQVFSKLALSVGVSADAFSPAVEKALHQAEQIKADFGPQLKKTAAEVTCQFSLRQPFVSLGCVRLHEKSEGKWVLSILDNEPIETIRSLDARVLVERSVTYIEQVEAALKDIDGFAENLKRAYATAKGDNCDRVSANLLMVLCSHGRQLKKHASSSGHIDIKTGFTRAQFSYLLGALKHSQSGFPLHYHGATQHESQPERYIAVPESPDPRVICECHRITAITINI
jgi:hypothetical protein